MNNKKQVREFIAVKELQYDSEQEFINDIDKTIAEMKGDESVKNQLRFYKQVRKALMPKKEAIAILEKTYGKQLKFRGSADWGGIPVWGVKTKDGFVGYFIVDDHENFSDTFSFLVRTRNRRTLEYKTNIIHTVDYHNMEKLITAVKHYMKNKI